MRFACIRAAFALCAVLMAAPGAARALDFEGDPPVILKFAPDPAALATAIIFSWTEAVSSKRQVEGHAVQLRELPEAYTDSAFNHWSSYVSVSGASRGPGLFTSTSSGFAGTGTQVVFANLIPATTYEVRIRGQDVFGARSAWVTSAPVATDAGTPIAPSLAALVVRSETLQLSWDAPAKSSGADISGYKVRYVDAAAPATYLNAGGMDGADIEGGGGVTTYALSGLTNGITYRVQIAAANTYGTGIWSAERSGAPGVTLAPRGLGAHFGNAKLTLTWRAPAHDGGVDIDNYRARWALAAQPGNWLNPGGADGEVVPGGDGARTYELTGLANGSAYAAQIAAENRTGTGAWRAATGTPLAMPSAPRALRAVISDGQITVHWQASADNGGSNIRYYNIRWAEDFAADTWLNPGPVFAPEDTSDGVRTEAALQHTIENLTNGRLYLIEVAAVSTATIDLLGFDMLTWASIRDNPATPPDTPTGLRAQSGSGGALRLQWTAPANTGGDAIIEYALRWSEGLGSSDWQGPRLSGSPALSYELSDLDEAREYAVQIAARNDAGSSAFSASAGTPPSAPILSAPVVRSETLQLRWVAPSASGEADLSGYKIRWAEEAAPAAYLNANGADGADIAGAGVTTYALSGLTNGTAYRVQIAAANRFGGGIWSVAQSGEPLGAPSAPRALRTVISDEQINLHWQPPANNGGSGILHYHVRWAAGSAADTWLNPAAAGASDNSLGARADSAAQHVIANLTNGMLYQLEVAAVSEVARDVGLENLNWASIRDYSARPPDRPTGLRALSGAGFLRLQWSAPANNGGDAISAYVVRWSKGENTSDWQGPRTPGPSARSYDLIGLEDRTQYEVQIAARNRAGTGTFSASGSGGVTTAFSMDLDSSGAVDWKDGVITARHLAGLRGAALVAGINASLNGDFIGATIEAGIRANLFDVDDKNGVTIADGIMIARYHLGVRGAAITDGMTDAAHADVTGRIVALP
ncbi:MAG: fibronectin type III domain-containing protein [Gammaproteobacteria bacterium]